jgi:hypothetical protein
LQVAPLRRGPPAVDLNEHAGGLELLDGARCCVLVALPKVCEDIWRNVVVRRDAAASFERAQNERPPHDRTASAQGSVLRVVGVKAQPAHGAALMSNMPTRSAGLMPSTVATRGTHFDLGTARPEHQALKVCRVTPHIDANSSNVFPCSMHHFLISDLSMG